MDKWPAFKVSVAFAIAFSMIVPAVGFVSVGMGDHHAVPGGSSPVLLGQLIGDELLIGEHVFAVHGDLDDRALYLDGEHMKLDGIVPWWVSGLEMDGSLHLVIGDAAYRTFLSHYIVSYDGGETWNTVESFWGFLKPHIAAIDDVVYLMFERSVDDDGCTFFKITDGRLEEVAENPNASYAEILDYRLTGEYAAYDLARKKEVFGRPAKTMDGEASRAPEKEWSYIYVCNGEASGIEALLEADANEMAAGGSSANHWSICLFDDDGAGTNEVRVMDEGGGGGYTSYTMAEVGLPAEPNLGDPSTFVIFLEWCFINYPGINVVWDSGGHGGGTGGAMYDETPVDVISLTEITTLADDLMTTLGRPINITSWDLCIMMIQEWLYGYKPITNYTVCSMDNIVGAGYNYQNLMNYLAAGVPTVEEMALEIASDYWTGESAYISTVNMDNWDYTFQPTFNNLCQELRHGSYISQINTAWTNAFYPGTAPNHDVWEWMNNINTGISNPPIQALALQARDEVWTANYPGGLSDVVLVEYGASANHHGLGDEQGTNSAWQIDIETMRDEMLSESGISNNVPTCTITSPTAGSDIPMDGVFTIQGTASDSDGSVSQVEVKINREWWQVATGTNSWSFSWDVTSDVAYYGIGHYKIMARSYDGTDYSNWECIDVNVIESYGSAGVIELDQDVYPVEDTMTVTVKDGDLVAPSITVHVDSTSEPSGESVDLFVTATPGRYEGTLTISATNSVGVLMVADGDTITATYDDADDGTGSPATATDTATVDGQVAPPSGLAVEWWGTVAGTAFDEDFSGGLGGWTIVDGGTGTGPAQTWTDANPGLRTANAPITTPFAIVDSDEHGTFDMDEELISPIIDMTGTLTATLEFDHYFYHLGPEFGDVDVRSSNTGGAWTNVAQYVTDSPNPDHANIDITTEAAGANDVQIRFHYYNANYEWYWMVDNILVTYVGGGTTEDNKLTWTLSPDDGGGQNDVVQYNIYRADNEFGPWDAGAYIDSVPAGTTEYVDPGRGEFDGTNWWYVVRAEDAVANEEQNTVAIPEIPTGNMAPSTPSNPVPADLAVGIGLNPTLFVDVSDPNGDLLDVSFYDASGPTLIGTDNNVPSGGTASINWNGLSADTTYNWYAVADDGEFTTQSPTWQFTTMDTTPPGPPSALTVEWWGSVSQTWIDEDFATAVPPSGWNIYTSGTTGTWSQQSTSNAGGTSPEARFYYGSDGLGTSILYAGPFDTTGLTSMDLQWQNMIDDYTSGAGVRLSIRTSTDATTWIEDGWYWDDTETPGDTTASLETLTVTTNVGSSSFYIGWAVTGNSYQLMYWYIDDVLLTSTGGGTTEDNWLNWTLSADDGAGANDVDHYNIYRANNVAGPWIPGAIIDTVPAGTDTYMDFGVGEPDGITWWYVVRAVDIWGNEELNSVAVPEPGGAPPNTCDIPITVAGTGWQFVSFPIDVAGSGVLAIFDDDAWNGEGANAVTWDVIYWYDPTDATDPWKSYNKNWGGAQDMPGTITNHMGFWIHITSNPGDGDGMLTVGDGADPSGETIMLDVGWNLVGFPSNAVGYQASDLPGWGATITKIGYYNDPSPYNIIETTLGTTPMSAGNAYWVYSTIVQPWNLV